MATQDLLCPCGLGVTARGGPVFRWGRCKIMGAYACLTGTLLFMMKKACLSFAKNNNFLGMLGRSFKMFDDGVTVMLMIGDDFY